MNTDLIPYYKLFLEHELARRCEKNPRYSLRSFARALGLNPASLSRVLTGKRPLAWKAAQRLLKVLDLSPAEERSFLLSVVEESKSRKLQRLPSDLKQHLKGEVPQGMEVSFETFKTISDWEHYAIRQLTCVKGFRPQAKWIAGQLGITETQSKLAVERLLRVGLLKKENGTFKKTDDDLIVESPNLTSSALKKHQKQLLQKAADSIENDPIDTRSMSSLTLAIDPAKLPLAKKMISDFEALLGEALSEGERNQVYQMQISFFPLQKSRGEKS